jgi:hypothetical protein
MTLRSRTMACRTAALLSLVLVAAWASRAAPTPAAQPDEGWRRYWGFLRQGNYLGALRVLQEERWEESRNPPQPSSRLFGMQILAEVLGAVGRYREAQEAFNRREPRPAPPPLPSARELKAARDVPLVPAEQLVLDAAREHQIVILNETHYHPEHRAFGARLIPRLRALGVKYFALETDGQGELDEAMRTGRVLVTTDPYAFEPQRAELLRAVLRSGMKMVAFDRLTSAEQAEVGRDPIRGIPAREAAMARNIDEQILHRDPGAKILIWVGMGHACKQPLEVNGKMEPFMALRLWQRTGIEPFTIYQLTDSGDPALDDRLYRLVAKSAGRSFQEPKAVRLPLASFSEKIPETLRHHPLYAGMVEGGLDAVILHPPDPWETAAGRPAWLRRDGAAELLGIVRRGEAPCEGCLVQALVAGDGDLGAPADQVLTDSRGEYHLRLRPGRYRLRVWEPAERAGEERVVAALPDVTCKARAKQQRIIRLGQDELGLKARPAHRSAGPTARERRPGGED